MIARGNLTFSLGQGARKYSYKSLQIQIRLCCYREKQTSSRDLNCDALKYPRTGSGFRAVEVARWRHRRQNTTQLSGHLVSCMSLRTQCHVVVNAYICRPSTRFPLSLSFQHLYISRCSSSPSQSEESPILRAKAPSDVDTMSWAESPQLQLPSHKEVRVLTANAPVY